MYRSILLPVGSSDFDGPDVIVIPWGADQAEAFRSRLSRVRAFAEEDEDLTCARFRDGEALAFTLPEDDSVWQARIDEMHAENSVLTVEEAPEYFAERWAAQRVSMPDPARVSVYSDGSVFLSGPIGLSSLRWETSCGLNLEESGFISPARKRAVMR